VLVGLAGRKGSGLWVDQGSVKAEQAMSVLSKAVALGYRNAAFLRTEPALHSRRDRPDFRLLMLDLVFPGEPFARGG